MSTSPISPTTTTSHGHSQRWTPDEHARYLVALRLSPCQSWVAIAKYVGTRTPRQAMTHAHKIAQKEQRHARGLKAAGRPPRPPKATEETQRKRPSKQLQLRPAIQDVKSPPASIASSPVGVDSMVRELNEPMMVDEDTRIDMIMIEFLQSI